MKKLNISLSKQNLTDLMLGKKLKWDNVTIALQDIGFDQMYGAWRTALNKYHNLSNTPSKEINPIEE